MAIILPDLPYAWRIEPYIDNNALAPDKLSPNLCQQRKCSSWKTPWSGEDLEALLADIESISWYRQSTYQQQWWTLEPRSFLGWWLLKKTAPFSRTCSSNRCNIWFIRRIPSSLHTAATTRFGSGWAWLVVNKKVNLKWLQQQTKIHQISEVKNQSWAWTFGNMLTTLNTATCVWLHQLAISCSWNKVERAYAAAK